jgi:hypothetical protein
MTFVILLGAGDRRYRADSGLRLIINILALQGRLTPLWPVAQSGHCRRLYDDCYPSLERELAASGRQRALAQYKYFGTAGGGSLLSGPPAGEDLLLAMLRPPPSRRNMPTSGGGETAATVRCL